MCKHISVVITKMLFSLKIKSSTMDYDYSRFGLTKREAVARGIRPLEYVAIELPEFAEESARIPKELSDKIKGLDLVWTLSVEGTCQLPRPEGRGFLA